MLLRARPRTTTVTRSQLRCARVQKRNYSLKANKKVAVVLSGCGVFDGSEIHEAVSVMLHISRMKSTYKCFAPDKPQMHVINHLTKEEATGETRNALVEAARIARGSISPLSSLKAADFDCVIFPGGFGAAKNLCTYAKDGTNMTVDEEVVRVVKEFHEAKKPIGMCCIAPVIAAKLLPNANVTIGVDGQTASVIAALGGTNVPKRVTEACVDKANLLVTAPAYMYGEAEIYDVYTGIGSMVENVLLLCKQV